MELPSHFDHEKLDVYQLELKFLAWVTQFLADLCGPSLECAACLDASVAKGFVVLQRIEPGKAMLVRTVAMLTKLLERFDPEQFRVRESPSDPVLPFEHEHEHDDEHD